MRQFSRVCCSCTTFGFVEGGCKSTLAALFFALEVVGRHQIAQTEKRNTVERTRDSEVV